MVKPRLHNLPSKVIAGCGSSVYLRQINLLLLMKRSSDGLKNGG